MDQELPDVQAGLRKGRGIRSNCQHLQDHSESKEVQKNIYFCFNDYAKAFDCVDHNKLWDILKEMGIADHLICLLKNVYVGQEATIKPNMKQWTGSKWERTTTRLYIVTDIQSISCKMLGWMTHKLESRMLGEIINSLRYSDDTKLITEWRGTKEPLDEHERGQWKSWLKTQHSIN